MSTWWIISNGALWLRCLERLAPLRLGSIISNGALWLLVLFLGFLLLGTALRPRLGKVLGRKRRKRRPSHVPDPAESIGR